MIILILQETRYRDFLVVQQLRFQAPKAGGPGSDPQSGNQTPHASRKIKDPQCCIKDLAQPNKKNTKKKKEKLITHEVVQCYQKVDLDFPGGTVEKNLTANAGDMGSILGPGRFHMPGSN